MGTYFLNMILSYLSILSLKATIFLWQALHLFGMFYYLLLRQKRIRNRTSTSIEIYRQKFAFYLMFSTFLYMCINLLGYDERKKVTTPYRFFTDFLRITAFYSYFTSVMIGLGILRSFIPSFRQMLPPRMDTEFLYWLKVMMGCLYSTKIAWFIATASMNCRDGNIYSRVGNYERNRSVYFFSLIFKTHFMSFFPRSCALGFT